MYALIRGSFEIGFCIADIDHTLAHLDRWSRPQRVATPVALLPGSSVVRPEPRGVSSPGPVIRTAGVGPRSA